MFKSSTEVSLKLLNQASSLHRVPIVKYAKNKLKLSEKETIAIHTITITLKLTSMI